MHRPVIAGLVTVLIALTICGAAAPPAAAQVLEVNHPAGLMRMLMNDPTPTVVGVDSNGNPEYWSPPGSRFMLFTGPNTPRGGDPTRIGDENRPIVSRQWIGRYGVPAFTSLLQLSVNMTRADRDGLVFDPWTIANAADATTNPANLPPLWAAYTSATARGTTGTFVCPVDDDQDLDEPPLLQVAQNYQLVGDVLMLEIIVYNPTPASHWVGLRHAFDGWFGAPGAAGWLDGQPLILDDGTVVATEARLPDPNVPGSRLPVSWLALDDANDPLISVKGILQSNEILQSGGATESAGRPDRFEVGLANRVLTAGFAFQPNTGLPLTGEDWAVAVCWEERELRPGASRRFLTYIGFGASVGHYDPPFATMSYAPRQLEVQVGDDPSTPDVTEAYYLTDRDGNSPFPASVYVDNFGSLALAAATASISPPVEFSLFPLGQPRTFTLGLIPRNEMVSATWTLSAAGARPRKVTLGLTGPQGRAVDREIMIPAVPILTPRFSPNALEMISIPYEFINTDAEHVFQSLGGLEPGQPGSLIRWDPVAMTYRWFPHLEITNIEPGRGYWLLNRGRVPVLLPPDAAMVSTLAGYSIGLRRGWNQVGTPYVLSTDFSRAEVLDAQGRRYSLRQAADALLLQPTLFSYNPGTQQYEYSSRLSDIRMDPYEGYWILAYKDVTLEVLPPGTLAAQSVPEPVRLGSEVGGWRASLAVSGDGLRPSQLTLGAEPGASDGLDARDLVAPPAALGAQVQVALVSPDNPAGRLVDIQAEDGQEKVWYVQVSSTEPRKGLALSWPDLSTIPDSLVPILEDTATGARCYMRTTARYRFDVAPEAARLFKIIVRPRAQSGPMVSQVNAQATEGGNYSITYVLSAPAAVDVEIRNIAGVVIRRLATGQVSPAGANTLLWNVRSDKGSLVPAGRYLIQFSARSPETGQGSNVISTFEVTR